MLKEIGAEMLAGLLNQALREDARQALQSFAGKRFRLQLEEWPHAWTFLYDGQGFQLAEGGEISVELQGNLAGLRSLSLAEALPGARLHLSGDVYAAQALQRGLAAMKLQPEALLQHYLGVPLGQGVHGLWQRGQHWAAAQWVSRAEYALHQKRIAELWQRLEQL